MQDLASLQSSEAAWEPGITLAGYRFLDPVLPTGQVVRLDLQWSAVAAVDEGYKVFVHVLNHQGQVVTQRDTEPVRGSRPISSWAPGEVIDDRLGLWIPPDLPDGNYTIVLGLYDPGTLQRLHVCCPDGDAITLGTVVVENGIAHVKP